VEQSGQRPVILVDSGDVVLAGAPGDSTAVIRFLDSLDTALKCLLHVTAPRALSLLWEAPRGRETQCTIEPAFGEPSRLPLMLSCRVQTRSEAGYTSSGDYLGGVRIDPGRRLVLRWKGHTLVLAERPDPAHDPEFFRSLGIEPREYDVIVVKSHNTFRPAYRSITETIMRAATPGATNPDLFALPYRSEMRRLYPFSEAAVDAGTGRHEQHGGGRS
jgi:microcystin degradation protein MlrC